MRHYFLELLACPECRHTPLRLYSIRVEERPVRESAEKLRCRTWCGLHMKPASEVPIEECAKCIHLDVTEGVLLCENCGRWYPIIDGIPVLLDDKFRREKDDRSFLERNLNLIPVEVRKLMRKPSIEALIGGQDTGQR